MKTPIVFIVLAVALFGSVSKSQDILPKDKSGFYTFYEVVDVPATSDMTLLTNAKKFLKKYVNRKYRKDIILSEEDKKVFAQSHFLVYKKGSFGKHVDGAIHYSISVEAKENKYRYIITDFVFQPYARNRYGRFEPEGPDKPLETSVGQLNKWQWDAHKEYTKTKIETLIEQLKGNMYLSPKGEDTIEVPDDENW